MKRLHWFGIALTLFTASCNGGSKKLQLGGTCVLDTDCPRCRTPLVCAADNLCIQAPS